jgi:hypothetical protein
MKLDPMPEHFEIVAMAGDRETIERRVRQIFDPAAAQADEVVMECDVAIKPGPVMPVIHLVRQPGGAQDAQRVIDRVR